MDHIADIANLKAGDSYRSNVSGGIYQVTEDTTARYKVNNTFYLEQITSRNSFSNREDLKRSAGKISNNSVVFVDNGSKAPIPYLITTAPPMYNDYTGSGTGLKFQDWDEDSTTLFPLIVDPDLPVENYLTYSKYIGDASNTNWGIDGDFGYRQQQADPYGTRDATRLTVSPGSDFRFQKIVSDIEEDSTYILGVWFRRVEGSHNDNIVIEVQIRDAEDESGFVDIELPADNEWYYYERVFVAGNNTDRFSVDITGDEGDEFEISHPTIQSGDINRGYVATGKTAQIFSNQTYYAFLIPDAEGFVHYSWFSNIPGDDSDRVQAAADYAVTSVECIGIRQDDNWRFLEDGQTVDIDGAGCIIKGYTMGYDNDLQYDLIVDFKNAAKDVFSFQPENENAGGLGLMNMRIKAISPCNRVIFQSGVYAGWWHNLTIDGVAGERNIEVIYESVKSNIYNEFYRFDFKNSKTAVIARGNSTIMRNGRFLQNETSLDGSATLIHVGIENCGLPAFIARRNQEWFGLRGERLGGLYEEDGIDVDSLGGPKPLFYCPAAESGRGPSVNIYNIDAISGSVDSAGKRYAYLLDIEDGSFSIVGGDMQQLETPIIRSGENARNITLTDFHFNSVNTIRDSLADPSVLNCINCIDYSHTNEKSIGLSKSSMYRLTTNESINEDGIDINSVFSDQISIGTHDLGIDTIKSGVSNYFNHSSDFRLVAGYWNGNDFNHTLDYENTPTLHPASLLVSNGTASVIDRPVLRLPDPLAVGKYIIGCWVKVENAGLYRVEGRQTGEDVNSYSNTAIDSTETGWQRVQFLQEIVEGDRRFDLMFHGVENGDSIIVGDVMAYKVPSTMAFRDWSRLNLGFKYTDGTAISDPDNITMFYEDEAVIKGNFPHDFKNGITNVDSLKSQINAITDFVSIEQADTVIVSKGSEISVDGDNVAVSGYSVTLDVSQLHDGATFYVYIGDADVNNVQLLLLTGSNNIAYEGEVVSSSKSFSGTYHSLFCRWDGSFLRIDEH